MSCMCIVLCMISLPVFVTQIAYKHPYLHSYWALLWLSVSMACSCIPSTEDKRNSMIIILTIFVFMCLQGLILCIIIVYIYGCSIHLQWKVLYWSTEKHCGWARQPCSSPTGVNCTCNKVRLTSWLGSEYYLIVHLINLLHASTWPLLWW